MGWQSYVIGYSDEAERQKILDMINRFNNMPIELATQDIQEDQEWEYEGVKFKGDCGGEELIGITFVRIKNVYKRGMLQGCTHAVLCGNGGGRWATMRFLNQYIRGMGMRVRVDWYEKAMEKRFELEERERSRSPRGGTSSSSTQ